MTAMDQKVEAADGSGRTSPEFDLLMRFSEIMVDARTKVLMFDPLPQSEWTGGDSSNPKNFKMREPNCVPLPRGYLT